MPDDHLAGLAVGNVPILIVDHAHIDARDGAAEGTRADLARRAIVGQNAHHLGHAPDLDQGKAEPLLEYRMQLRLDAGAQSEAHLVRAVFGARRLSQQQRHDHAQIVNDRCPSLGDLLPPALRREAIGLNLAVARQHGAEEREDACVNMVERQRIVDSVCPFAEGRRGRQAWRTRPLTPARSRARGRSPWVCRSSPRCRECWPRSQP